MNNPWHILGLDPATATGRDVKAAYARLLKLHRPDQDPEGFQRLRGAYEAALSAMPESTTKIQDAASTVSRPPPLREDSLSQTPASHFAPEQLIPEVPKRRQVDAALEKIRLAAATRIRQKVRDALGEFDAAAASARVGAEERAQMLVTAFGKDFKLFAEVCTDERLVQHAVEGDSSLAHQIVGIWSSEAEVKRLMEFAELLQRRARRLTDAVGALLMMHVAAALGRWRPDVAVGLMNSAFPHLPPDQREPASRVVDSEVALGRLFEGFPPEHRLFWFGWIKGGARACTWRDSYSRQMLHFVMTQKGPRWAGFGLLQRFMPPPEWQALLAAIRMYYG